MPAGCPSKYKEEYCKEIIEFFSVDPFTLKEGGKIEISKLPTFERFASNIGINQDTLHEWKKVHPRFSESCNVARQMQKDILIQNGLLGHYNSNIVKFVAVNFTDMRDRTEKTVDATVTTLESLVTQSMDD